MKRLLSCTFPRALALATAATLAACGGEEPPKTPVLTADPPAAPATAASTADDGAAQTEIERGVAYVKNEKFAEAKEHFKKALAIKPSPAAWTYLGVTAEKTGDRPGAEDAYKNALKLDGGFTEAAENLSALYLDEPARPDEAIAVLKSALEKAKDSSSLLQNLAFAYGLKGDVESASRAYEAALAKGDDARIRFAYGTMLYEKKLPDKAAVQLKRAVDAAKDDAALLASIGRLLGATKAFGDCVKAFDKAIGIKGNEPEFFVRRGTCKHELKDEDGAQKDYEAAVQIDPKFAAGHYYLGLSLLSQNKRVFATRALEKAATFGKDGPIGKSAKDKLIELSKKK